MRVPIINLTPQGRLGNRMFNLMFGHFLARRIIPGAEICGPDLTPWAISMQAPPCTTTSKRITLTGHKIDFKELLHKIRSDSVEIIDVRAFGCRMDSLLALEETRALFIAPESMSHIQGFGEDELVIHVRAGDILAGAHRDYAPLPLSYYRRIIADSGLRPVFVGQVPQKHPYGVALREQFSEAEFPSSLGLVEDFERIRRSRNICISISTFSWLAAWMSDARRIYLPVAGFLNPAQRRDIDLLPKDDPRYVFTEFPVSRWRSSEAEVASLIHDASG